MSHGEDKEGKKSRLEIERAEGREIVEERD
jgi:hypothetical protein